MVKKTRQDFILDILNNNGFVTVKELVLRSEYSSATIHRDLIELEQKGLIKRSAGGAEAINKTSYPSLPMRYDFQKEEKIRIARIAAEFVEDGDCIFIDASTTASYVASFLSDKKDVHVITNNIELALKISLGGIKVTVLGGTVCESPSMLTGELTVENAMRFHADKAFFSTVAFSADGRISGGDTHHLIHRAMISNSEKVFFLSDAKKCTDDFKMSLCTFGEVDAVISDYDFDEEIKKTFPNTAIIKA